MMSKRMKDRSHPNNMVRDTDNMSTTTQMMVNLTDRELTLYLIPDKVEFIGYTNRLPKSRDPVLDLRVYEYVDLDGGGVPDTKKVKTASATIPQIVSNCGPEVIDRSKGIRYRRKRLAPSGLSTWEVDGSKGSKYTVRIKPIRKNKSVKRVDKMPVQVSCDCNFFRWQGPEHWAKTNDYLYGKPVGTASKPDVKDPKGKHWACKHVRGARHRAEVAVLIVRWVLFVLRGSDRADVADHDSGAAMARGAGMTFDPCPCCGCDPCDCDWGHGIRFRGYRERGTEDSDAPKDPHRTTSVHDARCQHPTGLGSLEGCRR